MGQPQTGNRKDHRSVYLFLVFLFSRDVAETSPYYEALKKDDVEVGFQLNGSNF